MTNKLFKQLDVTYIIIRVYVRQWEGMLSHGVRYSPEYICRRYIRSDLLRRRGSTYDLSLEGEWRSKKLVCQVLVMEQ